MGDDLKQNPIDIELPKGDAKTSIDAAYGVQTQDGEILVPELPDVDAVLADNSARTESVLADALGSLDVDTTTANRAYYDYLTAKAETKAAALSNAVDAINATIDTPSHSGMQRAGMHPR